MPNIPSIKIGNTTYDVKDTIAREHLVEVSSNQPTSTDNRLWIKNATNEYQIPTYEEFSEVHNIIDTGCVVCNSEYELEKGKYWNPNTGGGNTSAKYVRTVQRSIPGKGCIHAFEITNPDYLLCLVFHAQISPERIYLGKTDYGQIEYVSDQPFVAVNFKRVDDADMTDNDLTAIAAAFKEYHYTDTTLEMENKAADAKVVGDYIRSFEADAEVIDKQINSFASPQNLINHTLKPVIGPISARPVIGTDGYLQNKYGTVYTVEHGLGAYVPTAKRFCLYFQVGVENNDLGGLETGVDYYFSCDVRYRLLDPNYSQTVRNLVVYFVEADSNTDLPSAMGVATGDTTKYLAIPIDRGVLSEDRIELPFTLQSTTTKFAIYIKANRDDAEFCDNDFIELKNLMLTKGVMPIAWTPSLNDLMDGDEEDELICKEQQMNRKTRISGTSTFGTKPLCLLHFSDIHADTYCLERVIAFWNKNSNYIDDVIHTGDTVNQKYSNGIDWWTETEGAEKILNVIGNHDTKDDNGVWNGISMSDSYNRYFAPFISNWGLTNTESGKTYYSKDYTTEKVRLIVLDVMHQTSAQLTWFTSQLSSAKTAGLHVLVAVHSWAHWLFDSYVSPWDDKIISPQYKEGFTDKSAHATYPQNLSDDYATAVDNFMDGGGYFIAWIHGHTHFKMLAKLATHKRQLDISVANAGFAHANTYVWERVADTKSADDFNLLAIDTYSKILRVTKIGVNYDIYMRHTDTFSYDYDTHEMVETNGVPEGYQNIPNVPTENGTYRLQVTVASGVPTFSWVSV